ncbi:MAG: F0F1 ATP synthase subunit C, partial [Alphaproteobacteria bacterium]|nr:F0F1 ATP synthase subunit C [Alphaproteobacteria bacterium]
MEVGAAKMIGAGLAVIALLGVGLGLGNIFST